PICGKPDVRALCECGNSELPQAPRRKEQVQSPRCDSLCTRATTLRTELDRQCRLPPTMQGYDDPRCYAMEKRFFDMRPEIFECWCTGVSFDQRMWHQMRPEAEPP
ncbi:MAG: hypothetical protein AB7S68_34625, partial [Polyangiaceae bacterium]